MKFINHPKMKMNIQVLNRLKEAEIIHYADSCKLITSKFNTVYYHSREKKLTISLPEKGFKRIAGILRLARRALRLDKCNVFETRKGLIIIRQYCVYFYDFEKESLKKTLQLQNCRNVLHNSISQSKNGCIFFGEYGANKERGAVPVYRSQNQGESWECIFRFQPGVIKHIHGCYWDPYEKKIWTCTGDFAQENHLVISDENFENQEWIGDGQQMYRTTSILFQKNYVYWLMDSQLEQSYSVRFDRKNRQAIKLQAFPGPIWYTKYLKDGYYLASTANEIGDGVLDNYAHIFVSKDCETWKSVMRIPHDGLPKRYLKFGVIAFADGEQTSNQFYIHCEALKGYDGRVFKCKLQNDE